MNDAQWLRHWSSQHIQSVADRRTIEADELARKAELAANRDGFSVDDALREEGFDSLTAYFMNALQKRSAE
jgi:hypothetical protein